MLQFIRAPLEPRDVNTFLTDFIAFQRRISRYGLLNALSQTLCKLTAPGVPDIYQGNEIWDFSLVDPDNRRPVDYQKRRKLLAQLESIDMDACVDRGLMGSLVMGMRDGRCKLFLTWKVLQFRRDHAALFRDGEYLPLRVIGEYASNVCAFARRHEGKLAVTIAPRLYLRLLGPSGRIRRLARASGATRRLSCRRNSSSRYRYRTFSTGSRYLPVDRTAESRCGWRMRSGTFLLDC